MGGGFLFCFFKNLWYMLQAKKHISGLGSFLNKLNFVIYIYEFFFFMGVCTLANKDKVMVIIEFNKWSQY